MREHAFRQSQSGKPARTGEEPVCHCFEVSGAAIERAIRLLGLKTVEEVTKATEAGGGCGGCTGDIEAILAHCARGEYTVRLSAEDYAHASRVYGVPPPSAKELAANALAPERRNEKA